MIQSIHTETVSLNREKWHLPFEELIGLLQRQGFFIKPDDYIEMLKVMETYGSRGIEPLKFLLAPLIVTNETEQNKFYNVFDEYTRATLEKDLRQKANWRKKIILLGSGLAVFLTLALLLIFHSTKPLPPPPANISVFINGVESSNIIQYAIPGDTIRLDASGVYRYPNNTDTAGLHFSWNTGNGWEYPDQRSITVSVITTGRRFLQLKLQSGKQKNYVAIDSMALIVCNAVITSLQSDEYETLSPGDHITLQPVIRGNQHSIKKALWIINDKDTIRNKGNLLNYTFDTAGNYRILYETITDDSLSFCAQTKTAIFEVNKKAGNFQLSHGAPGIPIKPVSKINPWLWTILLIPIAGILLIYYLHQRTKRNLEGQLKDENIIIKEPVKEGYSPPYDVPFNNRDTESIAREPEMNLLFRAMRNKTEEEYQVLNISKSIQSEIRSGGMRSLVFTNRMKHQEYLILVDKSNANSQPFKLFEYLVKILCEENLNIERFYYRDFNLFYNENFPTGISLQRLADLFKTDVLIIFGNAHQLIYPAWPAVDKEKSNLLKEWEFKAILTPVAYRDWTVKEDALKKEIVLLPADIQGQVQLLQAIKEKQLRFDKYLGSFQQFYDTGSWYFTDVQEIREYLNDPVLFQWLCGICVYPKLRWEIVVEVGTAICKRENEPSKLNFSNLLKLVRIQWMQEGYVPEHTRLELLKKLSVENELVTRETLLQMLQYPDLYFKGHHFFEEEKKQQEVTNQFILFSNDPEKYKQYEEAYHSFKARWEKGQIYDGPLRRYLEKRKDDNWVTPVKVNDLNAGVEEFFENKKNSTLEKVARKFNIAYAATIAILVVIAVLVFFGKAFLQGKSLAGFPFVTTDSARMYPLSFTLGMDSCVKDPAAFAKGLSGTLKINQNEYALNFVSGNNATTSVPYYDARSESGIVELSWDENKKSASDIVNLSEKNSLVLRTCGVEKKLPLYVRYYNPSNNDTLSLLLKLLSNRYQVTAVAIDSLAYSQILFSDTGDEQQAAAIASIIDTVLKRKIPITKAIQEYDFQAPTLYLSFLSPEVWKTIPINTLPGSLSEIWKGAVNNRLMTISLPDRLIWYSTGDKNTYGTYIIEEASRKGAITKIIVSANKQYRVFFLQNISANGFAVCFPPDLLQTLEEANLKLTGCLTSMEPMRLYYPSESERIPYYAKTSTNIKRFYYPFLFGSGFNASERKLFQNFIKSFSSVFDAADVEFQFNVFWNNKKLVSRGSTLEYESVSNSRLNDLASLVKPLPLKKVYSGGPNVNNTPFDRDYADIRVSITMPTSTPVTNSRDTCSITYRNLGEAVKAGNPCRLDISNANLESIASLALTDLTTLKYLDIRNNFLTTDDSINLRKMLPNCEILFSPQKTKVQPVNWTFLQKIELDKSNYPSSKYNAFFDTIFISLRSQPETKIEIVSYYASDKDKKNAESISMGVSNYLQKKAALPGERFVAVTAPSNQQQQQQQQQQQKSILNQTGYVDIFRSKLKASATKN